MAKMSEKAAPKNSDSDVQKYSTIGLMHSPDGVARGLAGAKLIPDPHGALGATPSEKELFTKRFKRYR
jgi:hypothetical protein